MVMAVVRALAGVIEGYAFRITSIRRARTESAPRGLLVRRGASSGSRTAATRRTRFAETKEQLGGILLLEANDMDHAVALISKHRGVRPGGPFEIRPIEDLPGIHPRCSNP
jgi:hypothetical protein